MSTERKAVVYWQDKLAKFFPKSKGPTNCEIEMFKAGYLLASSENARLREALKSLANEAEGFLQCADAMQHGVTNMQVLWMRINESRAALEGK